MLFIVEAVIVFFTDLIKRPFIKSAQQNKVLFFEFVFIFFFGLYPGSSWRHIHANAKTVDNY